MRRVVFLFYNLQALENRWLVFCSLQHLSTFTYRDEKVKQLQCTHIEES